MLRIISQEPRISSSEGFQHGMTLMCQVSELLGGNSVIAGVSVRMQNLTSSFNSSSEHRFGEVLHWVSHWWHLFHSVAALVYVLWKLRLPLPLITMIKIKRCLLCGNFPVPKKKLPNISSFSRAPSAGQFSEGTTSARFCSQVGLAARKDGFDVGTSIISEPGQVFHSTRVPASEYRTSSLP